MLRLALVLLALSGCASSITLRASTNDFLKRKATAVSLNAPAPQVKQALEGLFYERGFSAAGNLPGENGSQVFFFKGPRASSEAASYGIVLGSWFAARVATVGTTTEVTLMGKPMVGTFELCSDHDELLKDLKYTCNDTKVPSAWAAKNLVSGRDETEVVSWVLSGLFERLKH